MREPLGTAFVRLYDRSNKAVRRIDPIVLRNVLYSSLTSILDFVSSDRLSRRFAELHEVPLFVDNVCRKRLMLL